MCVVGYFGYTQILFQMSNDFKQHALDFAPVVSVSSSHTDHHAVAGAASLVPHPPEYPPPSHSYVASNTVTAPDEKLPLPFHKKTKIGACCHETSCMYVKCLHWLHMQESVSNSNTVHRWCGPLYWLSFHIHLLLSLWCCAITLYWLSFHNMLVVELWCCSSICCIC